MPMGQYQNGNLGSAGEIGKYAVKLVCAVERRGNVLLCRAIARIGEVPQAEGFGKNQRRRFSNLAEKPLRG